LLSTNVSGSQHESFSLSFGSTVSYYQEKKYNGGLDPITEGSHVCISDFIADVELSVGKCLDPMEAEYFRRFIKTGFIAVSENGSDLETVPKHYAELDSSVRTKLGRHFIQAGIYPLSRYASGSK